MEELTKWLLQEDNQKKTREEGALGGTPGPSPVAVNWRDCARLKETREKHVGAMQCSGLDTGWDRQL